jgi:hypothetical protein
MVFEREGIDAGIHADVTNEDIGSLDQMRYPVLATIAETACGSSH